MPSDPPAHDDVFRVRSVISKLRPRAAAAEDYLLSLRATGDGWSLVTPSGEVAFQAVGKDARRRCLEIARDLSAIVLSAYG
jgi:hypothetical protein